MTGNRQQCLDSVVQISKAMSNLFPGYRQNEYERIYVLHGKPVDMFKKGGDLSLRTTPRKPILWTLPSNTFGNDPKAQTTGIDNDAINYSKNTSAKRDLRVLQEMSVNTLTANTSKENPQANHSNTISDPTEVFESENNNVTKCKQVFVMRATGLATLSRGRETLPRNFASTGLLKRKCENVQFESKSDSRARSPTNSSFLHSKSKKGRNASLKSNDKTKYALLKTNVSSLSKELPHIDSSHKNGIASVSSETSSESMKHTRQSLSQPLGIVKVPDSMTVKQMKVNSFETIASCTSSRVCEPLNYVTKILPKVTGALESSQPLQNTEHILDFSIWHNPSIEFTDSISLTTHNDRQPRTMTYYDSQLVADASKVDRLRPKSVISSKHECSKNVTADCHGYILSTKNHKNLKILIPPICGLESHVKQNSNPNQCLQSPNAFESPHLTTPKLNLNQMTTETKCSNTYQDELKTPILFNSEDLQISDKICHTIKTTTESRSSVDGIQEKYSSKQKETTSLSETNDTIKDGADTFLEDLFSDEKDPTIYDYTTESDCFPSNDTAPKHADSSCEWGNITPEIQSDLLYSNGEHGNSINTYKTKISNEKRGTNNDCATEQSSRVENLLDSGVFLPLHRKQEADIFYTRQQDAVDQLCIRPEQIRYFGFGQELVINTSERSTRERNTYSKKSPTCSSSTETTACKSYGSVMLMKTQQSPYEVLDELFPTLPPEKATISEIAKQVSNTTLCELESHFDKLEEGENNK